MAHFGGSFFDFIKTLCYNTVMQKLSFPHVEDYLEVIAGHRDAAGKLVSYGFLATGAPASKSIKVRLARYDMTIVGSIASQISSGVALTDRQGELVQKLLIKYQKQLASLGIDTADHITNPQYRMAIRQIDRSCRMYMQNGKIILKFAYNKAMVETIATHANSGAGGAKFDRELKEWQLDVTEYNLSWATEFAEQYGFSRDAECCRLMDLITECERTPYQIELTETDTGVEITNAESSLIDYINDSLGGISAENLLTLADNSSNLGFDLSHGVVHSLAQQHGTIIADLIKLKVSHAVRPDTHSDGTVLLANIVAYAELVNRWPIYIYEPDASNCLRDTVRTIFSESEILDTTNKKLTEKVDLEGKKCVYFNKLRRIWDHRIPCLISTHAMLHGAEKQHMLQYAEKVVYYTATTYDNSINKIL